ncbi:MAG: hypothetical protein V3W08_11120 [Candidatus Binatia bacterium]
MVLRTENDKNREKVESPSHALARLLDCDAGGAEQHKEAKVRWVIIATALLVTSCSVYMAAHQPDKKDLSVLEPGTARNTVIGALGTPASTYERDGKKVDMFVFVQGYTSGSRTGRAVGHAIADVFTLGLWEVVGTPIEMTATGTDMQVEVTYEDDDTVESVAYLKGEEEVAEESQEEPQDEKASYTPVTDPTQRLEFQGFSILPPRGENWLISRSPSIPPDPSWTSPVTFNKAFRDSKTHTFYAAVMTTSLGNVTIESRTELLQHMARVWSVGKRGEPQSTPLHTKVAFGKYLGRDCVRYESIKEDRSSRVHPGSVFIMITKGFIFLHPDSSTFLLRLEYSERYLLGELSFSLEAEVEPFFRSLVFTPIR